MRAMIRRRRMPAGIWWQCRLVFWLFLPLATIACSRAPEPLATLQVEPAEIRLPFPEFATLEVTLKPLGELPPGSEPQLFLHLLEEPGAVIRTFDQPVPGSWTIGKSTSLTVRIHQSALADPLEAGTYLLTAGLYDRGAGRFAVETDAKQVARLEYQVATVTVPPAGASLPAVRFSDGWLPAVPGQDRQVLVRRGLDGQGPGTFQIGPLRGPGQLLLRLAPAPAATGRMEIVDGTDTARVRLRSSCGGFEGEVTGDVAVETEIEVPATAAEISCDVELNPNFVFRSGAEGKLRSISIEVLAWRPGTGDE